MRAARNVACWATVGAQAFFRPTSLFDTLPMLGLLAGGVGLVARSLRPMPGVR